MFSKLTILDARGKVAATLNMAMGKGTEDINCYQNAELIFCNIDNIHVMRNSANNFADALSASAAYTSKYVFSLNFLFLFFYMRSNCRYCYLFIYLFIYLFLFSFIGVCVLWITKILLGCSMRGTAFRTSTHYSGIACCVR